MKKLFLGLVTITSLSFFGCEKAPLDTKQNPKLAESAREEYVNCGEPISQDYADQNIAIFDSRVRSINEHEYVKELFVKDFGGDNNLCERSGINGARLTDDGEGFDEIAGDGIYTTIDTYQHDETTPFIDRIGIPVSVQEYPIINENFQHVDALSAYQETYPVLYQEPGSEQVKPKGGGSIKCRVYFGQTGCYAQEWGWCDACCISIKYCDVELNW